MQFRNFLPLLEKIALLICAVANGPVALGVVVHDVTVGDNFFSPTTVTMFTGDQIKWTWVGPSGTHSTTSDSGLWDTGLLPKGSTFTRTFSTVGTFPYRCTAHAQMVASATVKKAGAQVSITSPAAGATFNAPATFILRATATDSDGAITNVSFFRATSLLTNVQIAPYIARVVDLAVGDYKLTAIAADYAGRKATNSITIHVVPDVTRPVVSIISPVASQRITNVVPNVTIRGRASDNVRVADVLVQLNNGAWSGALSTNGFTNWTSVVTPLAGTNRVSAYAVDPSGNKSLTNRVSFVYVVPSQLTLITNGIGSITRTFKGTLLEVGRGYTVTAVSGPGQVFSNWEGSVTSSSASLPFIMQSNMVLRANFIANPFLRAKGIYNGLFSEAERAQDRSGFVTLTLTDQGAYTASLKRGTNLFAFSGQFDVGGAASKTVNGWQVNLHLDLTGAEILNGTVSSNGWSADLLANRAVFNALTNPANQFKGKHTLRIPGSSNPTVSPAGDGFAALTVAAGGALVFSGSLSDGTVANQSVGLSRSGQWPLYGSLYNGQGSVWGWMRFDVNVPAQSVEGTIDWIKLPRPGTVYYPLGFTNDPASHGARYLHPTNAATRVIAMTNGLAIFSDGNLAAPFTNTVTLTSSNRFINGSGNSLTFSLTLSNGTFSGRVKVPGTTRTNSFKGAFLQDQASGYGFFLGTNQSGGLRLSPLP